jgi:spore germination cell wall hydrolase CwlJ-like protein
MFALAAEDRPVLIFSTKVRAAWRAPIGAVLTGAGFGLGLGALFLVAGMSGHAADHAHAQRMAEAAAVGYAGSYLEAEGQGLRTGLQLYAFRAVPDAPSIVTAFGKDRAVAKAKRRADLECLTEAVYYEARGESARGQAAVAQVVMNRVKHPAFPKSVCAVVFQGAGRVCQFSFACDGSMKRRRESVAWSRARDIAGRALSGALRAEIGSATHFHATAVSPAWAPQMLRVANVGTHVFYRFSPYRLRNAPAAQPAVEHAVLTADAAGPSPELRLMPALLEKAVTESLEPVSAPAAPAAVAATGAAKPAAATAPAPKAADSAMLTTPQPAAAGAS